MTTASSPREDLVEGQWVSATGLARGLKRLRAERSGEDSMVCARGAGEAGPGMWGPARAHVFATAVRSAQGSALIASFDRGHIETQIQTYPGVGVLVVHGFHRFKDSSGQAGYFTREFFVPDDGRDAEPGKPGIPHRPGSHDPAALTGTWRALTPAVSQIATLECFLSDGQLRARAEARAGTGSNRLTDWGEAAAHVYADAHHPDDPPAFLTKFEHDGIGVHVQARANRGVLVVCEYTEFSDDSGRRDHFLRECYQLDHS
ncbi:MAG TPA: hypothetical protein VFQ44_00260 [Streptosporangiaceae bacterium]|nr:hypothetical protein [Streptosporangiaceae bacterium]